MILKNASVRVGEKIILYDIDWSLKKSENWLIYGPNGAGKTTFAKTLLGKLPVVKGEFSSSYKLKDIGYVSFDLQSWVFDPFSSYSSGEMRKILIDKALKKKPKLLILDEPFAGLDEKSRKSFIKLFDRLMKKGTQLILITHHLDEIPKHITHVMKMEKGRIKISKPFPRPPKAGSSALQTARKQVSSSYPSNKLTESAPILQMNNVTVKFSGKTVLNNFNWTVKKGEHWAIIGPNGSGKSTLLKLITGETQQAYGNEIYIFDRKKGDGETVWEIKKQISQLYPESMFHFPKNSPVFEIIASGLFDSIGLYQILKQKEIDKVKKWAKKLKIESLLTLRYDHLSTGQKRLVLLARALIKSPPLLILDEPLQGLDAKNKKHILKIIDSISKKTQILYVTHHKKEIPKCINRYLNL